MDMENAPATAEEAVAVALNLAILPSLGMLVMAGLVFVIDVPKVFVRAMQHLAAGIVLSAVAVELVPIISEVRCPTRGATRRGIRHEP